MNDDVIFETNSFVVETEDNNDGVILIYSMDGNGYDYSIEETTIFLG
jgi:hypothetical protein